MPIACLIGCRNSRCNGENNVQVSLSWSRSVGLAYRLRLESGARQRGRRRLPGRQAIRRTSAVGIHGTPLTSVQLGRDCKPNRCRILRARDLFASKSGSTGVAIDRADEL